MEALRLLLRLLTATEKSRLKWVLFVAAGVGVLETLAVLSVLPFMAMVADPVSVLDRPAVVSAMEALGIRRVEDLLFIGGAGVLGLVLVSNAAATVSLRMVNLTIGNIIHYFSCRLLSTYLSRPYEWFLNRHSSSLSRNLLDEAQRVIQWALLPLLYAGVRGIGALLLVILLLFVDFRLTVLAGGVLGIAYVVVYFGLRTIQDHLGDLRVRASQLRFQLASEALGGIKEIKSLGVEKEFLKRFEETGPAFVRATAWSRVITEAPRYLLEVLAIGTVLGILLFLLSAGTPLNDALPVLALFAFAGYKLVPSFHLVFSGVSSARLHVPALKELVDDLLGEPVVKTSNDTFAFPLPLTESLELSALTFRFSDPSTIALDRIDLRVAHGERIGIVGPTGAGKTTLTDVVLGLLKPQEGELRVDDIPVRDEAWSRWRASVGYVPQSIFLSDETIEGNIAFGVPPASIDSARVEAVARMAELHEFVSRLPDGFQTRVGERGVRLSGGQRQRIGIARALYRDPSLLLLDEATSALDGATEEAIMDAVFGMERERTMMIIAHRMGTVRRCDRIVVLEAGRVSAVGTWDELMETSDLFRVLVRLDRPIRLKGAGENLRGEMETRRGRIS